MKRNRTRCGERSHVGLRGAAFKEHTNHDGVTAPGGDVEWRMPPDARLSTDMSARFEQQRREIAIAVLGGPVEGRHAVALRAVHIRALLKERTNGGDVSLHRCLSDARIPGHWRRGTEEHCHTHPTC